MISSELYPQSLPRPKKGFKVFHCHLETDTVPEQEEEMFFAKELYGHHDFSTRYQSRVFCLLRLTCGYIGLNIPDCVMLIRIG